MFAHAGGLGGHLLSRWCSQVTAKSVISPMMLRKATVESVRGDFSYAYILKRFIIDLSLDTILHWPLCPRTKTVPIFPKASVKLLAFSP